MSYPVKVFRENGGTLTLRCGEDRPPVATIRREGEGLLVAMTGRAHTLDRTQIARLIAGLVNLTAPAGDGQCPDHESNGVRCELPAGHDGPHECPAALAYFQGLRP